MFTNKYLWKYATLKESERNFVHEICSLVAQCFRCGKNIYSRLDFRQASNVKIKN